MKENISKLASDEITNIQKCLREYKPYNKIYNIEWVGLAARMFNNIYSGHKKRAKHYFDNIPDYWANHLPKWVSIYFNDTKEYKTYDDWKSIGRNVIKGEKSYKRNNIGQAVFSKNQTKEIKHQYVNNIFTERMLETSCPSGDTSIFWDIYCDNDHVNDPFHYN